MIELRCDSKKHGVVIEPGEAVVEIACNSRFCGASQGVTVLHRFNAATGELVETQKYKTPRKEKADASHHRAAPVRAS